MSVTNTNGSGAGSLRAAIDAVTTGPARISFTGGGTIPITTTRLTIDGRRTYIDGGANVVVLSNTNISGGSYSMIADCEGLSLRNLHFDNSAGPTDGSTFILADPSSASSTAQHQRGTIRNCYFRGPGIDDCAWATQRYRTVVFERCIFDGTTSTGFGAFVVGYSDNVGPGNELPWHVILKHCILLGTGRIPDVHAGTLSMLGCIVQRIQTPGQISGMARLNLVNNWFLNPSDVSYNTSTIALDTTSAVNGVALRAGSIYSSGNYQDGVPESQWVATAYAPTFYTDVFGAATASTYYRSTPTRVLPYVEDAVASRAITLSMAGPAVKSDHCLQAIAKAINRRPQGVL